jgi:hypothetical protein
LIIALPAGHDHLADALVRDLGFTKMHVDAPLRAVALRLDPIITNAATLANVGSSPHLSSRLAMHDGDWDRVLGRYPETGRFLERLRLEVDVPTDFDGDVVVYGLGSEGFSAVPPDTMVVAIEGREPPPPWYPIEHYIDEGGVVDQQTDIVTWVQGLRKQGVDIPARVT